MTMVASGTIDLGGTATSGGLSRSINFEFGYGTNLDTYRGVIYTNAAGSGSFQFPKSPNSISMSDFYSSRKIPSGSSTYTSNGTFAVPPYNTLTVIIRAAGGQGSGAYGSNACAVPAQNTDPSIGNSGGSSQFGQSPGAVYGSAPGGGGGLKSTAGTTQSGYGYGGNTSNAGGAGSGGNAAGGGGGVTVLTLVNPVAGGTGPSSGASVPVVVGTNTQASNGGPNSGVNFSGFCVYIGNNTAGSAGGAGSVVVSWQ